MSADPLRRLAWLRAQQEDLAAGELAAALAAAEEGAAAELLAARLARWDPPRHACTGAALLAASLAGARLRARAALAVEASGRAAGVVCAAADAHRRARQARALVERARLRREGDRRRALERSTEADEDDRRCGTPASGQVSAARNDRNPARR